MRSGLPRAAKAGAAVYLAVGEHENPQLRDGVKRFAEALEAAGTVGAPTWLNTDMKDEDHSSTPQRSLYNALEARYKEWRFPFFEDQAELDRVGGLKGLEAHYERLSNALGFRSPPPEARLLQVAGILTASARHDEVVQIANTYAAPYPMAERLVNQVGYDQLRPGELAQAVPGEAALGRQSYEEAARVAGTRSPPHPRLGWYQDKATKGCAPIAAGNRPE